MSDDRVSRKALERERRARQEAERLLEAKSRELWELNRDLENRVRERTVALEAAMRAACAADERKIEFLANMSHEIRTPMTSILGYAELLADDPSARSDPHWVGEAVGIIRAHGRHLLELINDILDVSRIEAGRVTLERVAVRPAAAVGEAVGLLRHRAADKGLELLAEFGTPMPAWVTTDPTRLRQVLVNLIGNAIKFTRVGSVRVRTSMEAGAEGECLRVDVIDTGIGLNAEQLARIRGFEAFTQADASTTRRFGGTGLGLRISSAYAELMGGGLDVDSTEGVGSTFTVRIDPFPVCEGGRLGIAELLGEAARAGMTSARSKAQPGLPDDRREGEASASEGPLAGLRVLLAEDGIDNQRLISLHLRRAGATVTTADNGITALELFERAGVFDVVLTDMQMPEMDGYALAGRLRRNGWRGPIFALTAHAMSDDRQRCLDAGCDDYLTKPLDRERLIELCSGVVRGLSGSDNGGRRGTAGVSRACDDLSHGARAVNADPDASTDR